jgi:hypothetical protein
MTTWRIDGADATTGKETGRLVDAATREEAEAWARARGILISSIRPATAIPIDRVIIGADGQPVMGPKAGGGGGGGGLQTVAGVLIVLGAVFFLCGFFAGIALLVAGGMMVMIGIMICIALRVGS